MKAAAGFHATGSAWTSMSSLPTRAAVEKPRSRYPQRHTGLKSLVASPLAAPVDAELTRAGVALTSRCWVTTHRLPAVGVAATPMDA
jgi:hypothetical protein